MPQYQDYWFHSGDNLTLYARDYQHPAPKATLVCIPGLTRNSADFAELCGYLAGDFRVIVAELRGRGKSDYDTNPNNYHPSVYVQDITALLDSLQLESVILMGTSLGGLVSMGLGANQPHRVQAIIVNDIGPEAEPAGMAKIKDYVNNPQPVSSWEDAANSIKAIHGPRFPNYTTADWQNFARNLFRENDQGKPELNYDPQIAMMLEHVFKNGDADNLWAVFKKLRSIPMLLIRGELSDLLSTDCVAKMLTVKTDLQVVEIPDCGHAPTLCEQQSLAAITQFLNNHTLHAAS